VSQKSAEIKAEQGWGVEVRLFFFPMEAGLVCCRTKKIKKQQGDATNNRLQSIQAADSKLD